jgi:hypothetical protein
VSCRRMRTTGSTTAGSLDARHQEEVRAIERQRTRALEQMACDGKAAEEEAEALRQVIIILFVLQHNFSTASERQINAACVFGINKAPH